MKNDNMDQLFKDKLDIYESNVSNTTWEGIADKLSEDSVKTRPFLWIVLVALVFVTLGYFFYKDFFIQKVSPPTEKEDNAIASIDLLPQPFMTNHTIETEDPVTYDPAFREEINTRNSSLISNALIKDHQVSLKASKQISYEVLSYSEVPDFQMNSMTQSQPLYIHNGSTKIVSKFQGIQAWPDFINPCYSSPNHYFFVELNAGLDFPFRHLGIQNYASEAQPYLDKRLSTEAESMSFNGSLLAGYIHPVGIMAKTGVQFAQLNEKFHFVKKTMIKIQTQITIDTTFKTDGSYIINRDTSTVEVMGEEVLKTNNHFRMIDIPLIFGYRYNGARFALEFNTGIIFNITNYSSGRIFDQQIQPNFYGKQGDGFFSPFKSRLGLSLYGGVRYMTGFYGRTQFYIEPNFRYYFNSFSTKEYPLSQRYFSMGISSGMKYFF